MGKKLCTCLICLTSFVPFSIMLLTRLFMLEPNTTQLPMETRMERIERKIDQLLSPYRAATGRFPELFDPSYSRNVDDLNNETDYDYIYDTTSDEHKTNLVSTHRCPTNLHVLLLVASNLNHFEERKTIRLTWGQDPVSVLPQWKVYFLVGRTNSSDDVRKLAGEIRTHGDIVLSNIYENFYNLTWKLQAGFEWANSYCNFNYLFKGDDDVFVNVPKLFSFVNDAETPKESLYAGNVHYAAIVVRSGRYGVTKLEYRKRIYPRYCSGGGFILTPDVVKKFLNVMHLVKSLKIDDAYVGELALKSGVDVLHDDRFQMFEDSEKCLYKKEVIVHHPAKTKECMMGLYSKNLLSIIAMGKA